MRHGPTGKILVLNVDFSVFEQKGHCWMGVLLPVVPSLGTPSGSAETQAATQAQEETEFIRLLWLEIVQGGYDDTIIDQEISKVGGCLIIIRSSFHARQKIGGGRSSLERSDWTNQNPVAMVSQRSECR